MKGPVLLLSAYVLASLLVPGYASTVSGKCIPECNPKLNQTCCSGNCAAQPGKVLSGLQTTQLCKDQCCPACQPPGGLPDWDGGSVTQLTCAVVSEARRRGLNFWPQWAYIMATIEHETGKNYKPNRECYDLPKSTVTGCDKILKKKGYAPFYGRGYVQITFKTNYEKFQKIMGCPLTTVPDLALLPDVSLYITVAGMKNGTFTGVGLEKYIPSITIDEKARRQMYVQARRVINGQDKAGEIADLALKWEGKVRACVPEGGEWVCDFPMRISYAGLSCRTEYRRCPWNGQQAPPPRKPWQCWMEPCSADVVKKCCNTCATYFPGETCGSAGKCSPTEVTSKLEPKGCKNTLQCAPANCGPGGTYTVGSFFCPPGCRETCFQQFTSLVCTCSVFAK